MKIGTAEIALVLSVLALGWGIYTWFKARRPKLNVVQRGSNITNSFFAIRGTATGVMLEISITNASPNVPAVVRGFDLEPLWRDEQFDWLFDPAEAVPSRAYYQYPGTILSYPREMVLNHRTYEQGKLMPGETMTGMLMGYGYAPIPDDLRHGSEVSMRLTVFDQDGRPHSERFLFRIDKHGL